MMGLEYNEMKKQEMVQLESELKAKIEAEFKVESKTKDNEASD